MYLFSRLSEKCPYGKEKKQKKRASLSQTPSGRDYVGQRPSSCPNFTGRLKLHVIGNFHYLLGIAEGPPARAQKILGVFDHLSAKRSAKGAQKVQKRPKFLHLRQAGGHSAGPGYPLAVQL